MTQFAFPLFALLLCQSICFAQGDYEDTVREALCDLCEATSLCTSTLIGVTYV